MYNVDVNEIADHMDSEWVDTNAGMHGNHRDIRNEATEDKRKIDGRHPVNSQLKINKHKVREALGGQCCECGENRIHLLDVHHVNKNGKEEREQLGNVPYWRHIWREVKKGSKNYVLMCKNCHYDLHHKDRLMVFILDREPVVL